MPGDYRAAYREPLMKPKRKGHEMTFNRRLISWLFGLAVFALFISPGLMFGADSKEQQKLFTQRVFKQIQSKYSDWEVTVISPLTLKVKTKQGREFQVNLDNLWKRCDSSPSECEKETNHIIAHLGSLSEDNDALTKSMVRAVLKNSDYLKAVQDSFGAEGAIKDFKPLPSRLFVPDADLHIVYVADYPSKTRLLNAADCETLKLRVSDIHNLAIQNLNEALPDISPEEISELPGIFLVKIGDGYEASLLLLHDRWTKIAKQVKGDLIIAAPARDLLLFSGSESTEAIKAMRQLTRELYAHEPYALTDKLLKRTRSEWVIFDN